MTDTFIALLMVGACAIFLGSRALRSLQGKGSSCCGCAGGCNTEPRTACDKPDSPTPLKQIPGQNKERGEQR